MKIDAVLPVLTKPVEEKPLNPSAKKRRQDMNELTSQYQVVEMIDLDLDFGLEEKEKDSPDTDFTW